MLSSPPDLSGTVHEVEAAADACLAGAAGDSHRAAALAEMLRALRPGAPLYACAFGEADAALDEDGRAHPEWTGLLRDGLRVPHPGRVLAREEIAFHDHRFGVLGLAVPAGDAAALESARALLAVAAQAVAARLEVLATAEENGENARLAEVAEVSGPLAHEFNNFLNALMLHLGVLQYKLPQAVQPGLEEIRRQALTSAALVQQFQNYRRRSADSPEPVDLNRAVRGAVRALGGRFTPLPTRRGMRGEGGLETTLSIRLPSGDVAGAVQTTAVHCRMDLTAMETPVIGSSSDLQRLCTFLLRNAAGAAAIDEGGVAVHTSRIGDRVVLRIEDGGPPPPPQWLAHLFDASAPAREGTCALELAACRTMARRQRATIRAEARPEGGAALVLEWGVASI